MKSLLLTTFKSLRHRNFRLFFLGQLVSLTGTWVQNIAQSWLVYRLTDSPLLLGLTGFVGQIPVFLFGLFGGVVADHYNRHRIILITQTLSMVQAFLLAALVLSGQVQIWEIFSLAFFLGSVSAFDLPARQSFFIEMVGKEDLPNAIALNSSAVNGARLMGPVIAGLLVGLAGEGVCFFINGLSFLAVIGGLFSMKISSSRQGAMTISIFEYLKEGILYGVKTPVIKRTLLLLSLLSLVGLPYSVLMPVFSKTILKGGPGTFGFLLGGAGLGALLGTLTLARIGSKDFEKTIFRVAIGTGISFIMFSFSKIILISFFILVATGFCMMSQLAATNTLLQTVVPDRLRGRLMSFYGFVLLGIAPFGSLLEGFFADKFGAPLTVGMSGALIIGGAFLYFRRAVLPPALKPALVPPPETP
ncbi:MAG: MFS transporter [Nitrospirae bacterium]|nr:MFS transporter [Nitrospirota bacterium]MBI3352821.1 MFS transporter [Nitrospirota bacterium]